MIKLRIRTGNPRLTPVGISCADHATPPYPQKLPLNSPTSSDRSAGIVGLLTTANGIR
jgi:hypothetical protein